MQQVQPAPEQFMARCWLMVMTHDLPRQAIWALMVFLFAYLGTQYCAIAYMGTGTQRIADTPFRRNCASVDPTSHGPRPSESTT